MNKKSTYAQMYARAAKRLGLQVEKINQQTVTIRYRQRSVRFFYAMCSYNDSVGAAISRYKQWTNSVLKQAGVPVFQQATFSGKSRREISRFVKHIKFPVVVKPLNSLQGYGITANIQSLTGVYQAIETAAPYGQTILVEKHYAGNDYRILIANGRVLAVTLRSPAQIVGDGKHTVNTLILRANRSVPHKIKVDDEVKDRLLTEDLTLTSVPAAGRVIPLRHRANVALGGTTINLDPTTVHRDVIRACLEAVEVVGLKLAGVDFMTSDITQSYKKTKGGITEINDNPAIDIHSTATENRISDIAERVLVALLK